MKKRDFNKILKSCLAENKLLDVHKISNLTDDVKNQCVNHLIRYRGPILIQFLSSTFDKNILHGCGYLYETKGKNGFVFVHTCEHIIR